MKSIWKYPLHLTDSQYFEIPAGAKPLCIHLQKGTPTVWFEVNLANSKKSREILIIGTGRMISQIERFTYLGSFLTNEDDFVWHVYVENSNV